MALSSDYVIQIAPHLSASSAGVSIAEVADKALVLSLISGGIALLLAYLLNRREIVQPGQINVQEWESLASAGTQETAPSPYSPGKTEMWSKLFAVLVPAVFLMFVVYMLFAKFSPVIPAIEGGNGAALIGGTATILLILACLSANWKRSLHQISEHLVDGLLFAFRAMGPVLPIAGFFFIGNSDFATRILSLPEGATAPSFLFELVQMGQSFIPENLFFSAFGMLIIGMLTGLDGSGFSGLPLTGSLSGALGTSLGIDPATLAAIGQMGAIWVGGGTLIAWSSLVAVAGFTRVPVLDLVRKNFWPVMAGLVASTLFAIFFF
ncbi:putative transport protein [Caldalkalibacillus thermarum TA2.A1]|nr:putative transport protein [Caldalkalibacillus thermarum TA2.A1]